MASCADNTGSALLFFKFNGDQDTEADHWLKILLFTEHKRKTSFILFLCIFY